MWALNRCDKCGARMQRDVTLENHASHPLTSYISTVLDSGLFAREFGKVTRRYHTIRWSTFSFLTWVLMFLITVFILHVIFQSDKSWRIFPVIISTKIKLCVLMELRYRHYYKGNLRWYSVFSASHGATLRSRRKQWFCRILCQQPSTLTFHSIIWAPPSSNRLKSLILNYKSAIIAKLFY